MTGTDRPGRMDGLAARLADRAAWGWPTQHDFDLGFWLFAALSGRPEPRGSGPSVLRNFHTIRIQTVKKVYTQRTIGFVKNNYKHRTNYGHARTMGRDCTAHTNLGCARTYGQYRLL